MLQFFQMGTEHQIDIAGQGAVLLLGQLLYFFENGLILGQTDFTFQWLHIITRTIYTTKYDRILTSKIISPIILLR